MLFLHEVAADGCHRCLRLCRIAGLQHREALLKVMGRERVDERIEIAFHDPVETVEVQADAMVRAAVLRKIVGADPLAAVARADHRPPRSFPLTPLGLHLYVIDP